MLACLASTWRLKTNTWKPSDWKCKQIQFCVCVRALQHIPDGSEPAGHCWIFPKLEETTIRNLLHMTKQTVIWLLVESDGKTYDWAESHWLDGSQILEDFFQILQRKKRTEVNKTSHNNLRCLTCKTFNNNNSVTFFVQLTGRLPTNTVLFSLILSSALFQVTLRRFAVSSPSSFVSGALRFAFFGRFSSSASSAFCKASSLEIDTND